VPDHYTVLGVARSATATEIKAAYRRLIAQHHPDLNPSPQASDITAALNQAFAVLSDEKKRKLYDEELDQAAPVDAVSVEFTRHAAGRSHFSSQCQNCGRQDTTLRISHFSYTLSFLFFSRTRAVAGVWCETCRAVESAKWTLLSGLAGWWAIPWGPVHTIRDLGANCRGGKQPAKANATLLRSLGYEFQARGNFHKAVRAFQESLRFKPDPAVKSQVEQLRSRFGAPATSRIPSPWTLVTAAPLLILAVIWTGLIAVTVSRFERHRTLHPRAFDSSFRSATVPSAAPGDVWELVNFQIKRLSTVIANRSSRVSAHYEGSTLVEDYGLDRSRYDAGQLYPIVHSISKEFKPRTPDPGGFLASAYFNAKLFAVSVEMVNRIYAGMTIDAQTAQARELGNDPRVSAWLRASRFWPDYQALQGVLRTSSRRYKPGEPLEQMEQRAELLETTLQQLKSRQSLFQAEQNISGYNGLVPVYNRDLSHLKLLTDQIQLQLALAKELDLAFNRCLDGSILLSKDGPVRLTASTSKTGAW